MGRQRIFRYLTTRSAFLTTKIKISRLHPLTRREINPLSPRRGRGGWLNVFSARSFPIPLVEPFRPFPRFRPGEHREPDLIQFDGPIRPRIESQPNALAGWRRLTFESFESAHPN